MGQDPDWREPDGTLLSARAAAPSFWSAEVRASCDQYDEAPFGEPAEQAHGRAGWHARLLPGPSAVPRSASRRGWDAPGVLNRAVPPPRRPKEHPAHAAGACHRGAGHTP